MALSSKEDNSWGIVSLLIGPGLVYGGNRHVTDHDTNVLSTVLEKHRAQAGVLRLDTGSMGLPGI